MKKNFLQDVTPSSHRRSIKDIPLPKHKQGKITDSNPVPQVQKDVPAYSQEVRPITNNTEQYLEKRVFTDPEFHNMHEEKKRVETPYETSNPRPVYSKKKNNTLKKIIISGFLVGFIIVFFIVFGKSEAVITVTAKKSNYSVDTSIALDTPNTIASKTQISKTVSKTVPATQDQQIEQSAQGKIRIINKYREEPQELITNTRFQAPNGLIYRIRQAIEIPGYKMVDGNLIPGTLEVEVYADKSGEEYNISNTTFTIPGFQGREQYDKITAETVGDITGGYIGIRKVVTPETKKSIEAELKSELETQIKDAYKETSDSVFVPDMSTLTYTDTKDEASGNSVTLSMTATASTYSLPKQALMDFVGQNTVEGATLDDSFIFDPTTLTYTLGEKSIDIDGSTSIMWGIDIDQVKKDFAGKKKSEIQTIADTYNFISSIKAEVNPKWARKFPEDSSKIEVKIIE